jgi:hypothetical protein
LAYFEFTKDSERNLELFEGIPHIQNFCIHQVDNGWTYDAG